MCKAKEIIKRTYKKNQIANRLSQKVQELKVFKLKRTESRKVEFPYEARVINEEEKHSKQEW